MILLHSLGVEEINVVITVHVNLILRNTLISDQTSFACAQRRKRNRIFSSKNTILVSCYLKITRLNRWHSSSNLDASTRLYKSSSELRVKYIIVVDVHVLMTLKQLKSYISTILGVVYLQIIFSFIVVQSTQSKVKIFLFEAIFAIHPNRTHTPCCQVLLIVPSAF